MKDIQRHLGVARWLDSLPRLMSVNLMILTGSMFMSPALAAGSLDEDVIVNIAPGIPLDIAVAQLGQQITDQTGVQVMLASTPLGQQKTSGLNGTLPARDALRNLLKDSGLAYRLSNDTVTIAPVSESKAADAKSSSPVEDLTAEQSPNTQNSDGSNGTDSTRDAIELEEIVVTGSHIRGTAVPSTVITIGRDYIETSGYEDVGDLIRSLPQNFAGGISPQNSVGAPSAEFSNTGASSPNLRGLGASSTLTLINGHRMAQDSEQGAVDVSLIPLDAIDRVEVVTDGASAIYGSDAVAGVVNFVLRKDYEGARSTLSFGRASEGGGTDRHFSQLLGTTWNGGGVVACYEHEGEDAVFSTDRSFSLSADSPWTLLPVKKRNSAFLSGHQDVTSMLNVFADGLYTDRHTDSLMTPAPLFSEETSGPVKQYATAGGFNLLLPQEWKAEAVGTVAAEAARSDAYKFSSLVSGRAHLDQELIQTRTRSVELTADGPIYHSAAGPNLAAMGVGYRTEDYSQKIPLEHNSVTGQRRVSYAFGELSIPLVATSERNGVATLELHASGRLERYSDVGTKSVPKLGLTYKPIRDFTLRGSWSKSFRAPTLFEIRSPTYAELYPVTNPAVPAGRSPIILNVGGNPNLAPETATSWTLGAEFAPGPVPALRLSADYFHIQYSNRISTLSNPIQSILLDPVSDAFLTRSPDVTQQNAVIQTATGGFFNYSGMPYNPATVAAIADLRYLNFENQTIQGSDLLADYVIKASATNKTDIFLNTTFLQLRQEISSASPSVQLAGTVFNPPRFKAHGGASVTLGTLSLTGALNYLGRSRNTGAPGDPEIADWWTVDAQVAYSPKTTSAALNGLRISLSVQNLLDKNPPYLTYPGSYSGFHYDSLNATPLGRFITLQVSEKFW